MNKRTSIKNLKLVITIILAGVMITSTIVSASVRENKTTSNNIIEVVIPVGDYKIESSDLGYEISINDYGRYMIPGKPNLPSKIFAIAIPPEARFVDLSFSLGEEMTIPGTYNVVPSVLTRVIGDENPELFEIEKNKYDQNYIETYTSDNVYPERNVEFVRTAGYRNYNLVDVRVTPFSYKPLSGELYYYPDIKVDIKYDIPTTNTNIPYRGSMKTEETAQDFILNYNQAINWYKGSAPIGKGLHDYVIITTDALVSAVSPIANLETYKGRNVETVTTSWIDSNYDGYDLSEKIRNFLREKYPSEEWGIEDVLIVGDYNDVPMRRCWQDLGYGKPETDYYYAELSLPDSESWDANQNQRWGESYYDPIDFYTEVNVGRIPWSDYNTVLHVSEKSVAYEQNSDPTFKNNILLLGAFFWDNDPNPRTDNAVLMEYKVDSSIHPWMSDWTMTRMYEQGYSTYPMDYDLSNSNVVSVWSNGKFAFVDWAGHGSPDASWRYHNPGGYFISADDCDQLNDEYPAIIFADACSNSDTDHLNIGKAMIRQGAIGFVGATKVALGCPGWDNPNDGSSQSLDYYFTVSCTSGDYTQGQAHQRALREMYTQGLWSYNYYETFEWGALWGNPDLSMNPVGDLPLIEIGEISSNMFDILSSVSNKGSADATNVEWAIDITGGILGLITSHTDGTIDTLAIDDEVSIQSSQMILGLGKIKITIQAGPAMKTADGFALGPIILLA